MILFNTDVACENAQTLAFRIAECELDELRVALRAAFENADASLLKARWQKRGPSYRAERARSFWRVPSNDVITLADDFLRACNVVVSDPTRRFENFISNIERLALQVERFAAHARRAEFCDFEPENWISFASSASRDGTCVRRGPNLGQSHCTRNSTSIS